MSPLRTNVSPRANNAAMSVVVAPGSDGAGITALTDKPGDGPGPGAGSAAATGEVSRVSDSVGSATWDSGIASASLGGVWCAAEGCRAGGAGKAIAGECGISGSIGTDAILPSADDGSIEKLGRRLYEIGSVAELWFRVWAFGNLPSAGCASKKNPLPKKTPTVAVAMVPIETM
jgi:hypothetical protein